MAPGTLLSPSSDADEGLVLDASTAPTTPDGSMSFAHDDDRDSAVTGKPQSAKSLSSSIFNTATRTPPIRNICCVGAGYVGESALPGHAHALLPSLRL